MLKIYINLTNGLEFLKFPLTRELFLLQHRYSSDPKTYFNGLRDVAFVRIQSTWCEQKRYGDIINALSDDLLMNLAIGNECYIFDASRRKRGSRALWQGVNFIRDALMFFLFGKTRKHPNGMHVDFENRIKSLNKNAVNKLKYYKKFLITSEIALNAVCAKTEHDGDYEYFKSIVISHRKDILLTETLDKKRQ